MIDEPRVVWLSCHRAPFGGVVLESYLREGGPPPELVVLVPPDRRTGSIILSALIAVQGCRLRDLRPLSQALAIDRRGLGGTCGSLVEGTVVRTFDSIKDPDAVAALTADRPTVLLANSFPQILPPRALAAGSLAALNVHHGRLPEYRGHHATFWEFHDRLDLGTVTVHHMTERVDAGPAVAVGAVALRGLSLLGATIEKKRLAGVLAARAVLEVCSAPRRSEFEIVASTPARPWPTIRELLTTRLTQ